MQMESCIALEVRNEYYKEIYRTTNTRKNIRGHSSMFNMRIGIQTWQHHIP